MIVSAAEEKRNELPKRDSLQIRKSYLVDKIQTSTHGMHHQVQKITVMDEATNAFKVQTERNGTFWWDKKWIINIIEKL